MESHRTRKKSPVMPAEQKEKHRDHLKKTKKMSSFNNRQRRDGAEARTANILVKHQGSRRKPSGRDAERQFIKETTRKGAFFQVNAFRDDILCGRGKFEDIASRFSDCSSAMRGGDLEYIFVSINEFMEEKIVAETCGFSIIAGDLIR